MEYFKKGALMNFFRKADKIFDKTLTKGSQNRFLEYVIKYLITCGLGLNAVVVAMILYSIFK